MKGCLKGCLGRIVFSAVLLAGAAYAGWRWGGEYMPELDRLIRGEAAEQVEEGPQPTAEVAEAVLERVNEFRTSGEGVELLLDDLQVSSLLRFGVPGLIPSEVVDPRVEMVDQEVSLFASVSLDAFESLPALEPVVDLLPDPVSIRLRGALSSATSGYTMLLVDGASAGVVPLPGRAIPGILRVLGRADQDGLAPNAMLFRLPSDLESAFVRGSRLVLTSGR